MGKPDAATLLKEEIALLEKKRSEDAVALKSQLISTYESLKPSSIIRKTIHDIFASNEVQGDLVDGLLASASRFVSKKIEDVTSAPPQTTYKVLLRSSLQVAFTALMDRYSDTIKLMLSNLIARFFAGNDDEESIGEKL